MDALGLLSRDLGSLSSLIKESTALKLNTSSVSGKTQCPPSYYSSWNQLPTEILYPADFYPVANTAQQAIIDEYVALLEDFLGVKKTEMSIADRWMQNPPMEADGKPVQEYLAKVSLNLCIYLMSDANTLPGCVLSVLLGRVPWVRSIPLWLWSQVWQEGIFGAVHALKMVGNLYGPDFSLTDKDM